MVVIFQLLNSFCLLIHRKRLTMDPVPRSAVVAAAAPASPFARKNAVSTADWRGIAGMVSAAGRAHMIDGLSSMHHKRLMMHE